MILHSCEAFKTGCERIIVNSRDTDVMLLLLHFVSKEAREVWMISEIAMKHRCYPIHAMSEKLQKNVMENILSLHALIGCNTSSSFTGHGKKKCWKIFQ